MRSGDLLAEDYARALLDRAEAHASLNAFITLDRERVLEAARECDKRRAAGERLGRLHGLPIPVKDSVNTRGYPTTNGTRALRDFRPKADAGVLRPLLAEGAIVMGKTNLHEISRGWTSNNGAFGAVRNAYDPSRIPGGSSGGSATAVAAGIAPLAIAEDTLGSIRTPSSLCGVAGFRPTYARYPDDGIMPLTHDRFDQVGPLARSVADIVLFDQVVTGDESRCTPKPLASARIGVSEFLLSGLDPEVERIAKDAIRRLADAGAAVVHVEIPEAAKRSYEAAREIIGFENATAIGDFLEHEKAGVTWADVFASLSPNIKLRYDDTFTHEDHERALKLRAEIDAAMPAYFAANRIDALLFPPVLAPALPLGDNREVSIRGETVGLHTLMGRNTALSSCARLPSLTLPGGLTANGLPVGIELVAASGTDRALLSLGLAVERAWGRIPPPRLA